MTQSERYPPDDPREWLNRARSDLGLAKSNISSTYPEDLCFHAQQAAEKAIKALLVMHNVEFPYVHNLAQLLTLLEDAGESIPQNVGRARGLTPYATVFRYPFAGKAVTDQDAAEAVKVAEDVVRWAEGRV